jgi:hypothetical protein
MATVSGVIGEYFNPGEENLEVHGRYCCSGKHMYQYRESWWRQWWGWKF